MTSLDFTIILPEAMLALYALVALMAGAFFGKDAIAKPILWVTVAVLLATAAFIGLNQNPAATGFHGMFIDDAFSRFAKVVALISAAAV
ncbi:MAG: NADH-quinone oxidoreductase subunit N, partial [Paracoccus sp. (in: a-proteobacteria)]|nr:NADH-quinone oxidoreductase subunit N [Paracoccus sp. (in: a-proteobacteria)]